MTELDLQPVTTANEVQDIVHGTYLRNWNSIKVNGLSRMNRLHIHFASGLLSDQTVVSGVRRNVELYIYINLDKALASGIRFFKSPNGVILSPGDDDGLIHPEYFLKVCLVKDGRFQTMFL